MEFRRAAAQERDRTIERVRSILSRSVGETDPDLRLTDRFPATSAAGRADDSVIDGSAVENGDVAEADVLRGGPRARVIADRRSVVAFIITAILAAGLASAVTWFSRPTAEPVAAPTLTSPSSAPQVDGTNGSAASATSSAATTIVVSVIGYVASPGLVTLPEGARVADAIAACGGSTPGADLSSINLARKVADGEQIAVGVPGSQTPPGNVADQPAVGTTSGTPGTSGTSGAKVNLNTAPVGALDSLPGIGPVIAQRIVDFRTKNGAFKTVDDLGNVSGIGPSIMSNVKDLVTV